MGLGQEHTGGGGTATCTGLERQGSKFCRLVVSYRRNPAAMGLKQASPRRWIHRSTTQELGVSGCWCKHGRRWLSVLVSPGSWVSRLGRGRKWCPSSPFFLEESPTNIYPSRTYSKMNKQLSFPRCFFKLMALSLQAVCPAVSLRVETQLLIFLVLQIFKIPSFKFYFF